VTEDQTGRLIGCLLLNDVALTTGHCRQGWPGAGRAAGRGLSSTGSGTPQSFGPPKKRTGVACLIPGTAVSPVPRLNPRDRAETGQGTAARRPAAPSPEPNRLRTSRCSTTTNLLRTASFALESTQGRAGESPHLGPPRNLHGRRFLRRRWSAGISIKSNLKKLGTPLSAEERERRDYEGPCREIEVPPRRA